MRQLGSKKAVWSNEAKIRLKKSRNTPEYLESISGENSPVRKGGVSKTYKTSYDGYAHKIPDHIPTKRNPDNHHILQVQCKQCNKWFSPNIKVIQRKISGQTRWNLFCSQACCGVYYRGRDKKTEKPIEKSTINILIIKTSLYKQLLDRKIKLEKYNKQIVKEKRIVKNKEKILRKKEHTRKKYEHKITLLKEFKKAHPNRYKKYKNSKASIWFEIKRWKDPIDWRITRIVTLARRRSKKKGWKIDINKKWCRERIDKCEATGIKFDNTYEGTFITMNPYAPSIDRIDNNREYTKDNCRLVLTTFNSLKSTLSDEELYKNLKQFIQYYKPEIIQQNIKSLI